MKKIKTVLVTAPYFIPVVDEFRPLFAKHHIEVIIADVNERLSEQEILQLPYLKDLHGVIAGDDKWTRKALKTATNLKVLSKWGTGTDSFDHKACAELGIQICNTPNAFSEPVADTVIGLFLTFARNLHVMDQEIKKNTWEKVAGVSLTESTIGIIGVGNVGKAVARRAVAFGGVVLGTDIKEVDPHFIKLTGIQMVSKKELLSRSDFVTTNCDLNETSFHLMSKPEFSRMKNTAIFVNTARGPIVDEKALVWALRKGLIKGAGLDVYEDEPLPKTSPLKQMSNVILGSHNSNSSPLAWRRVHENTVANLITALAT